MNELKIAYQGKCVLVSGHTGFKGSWLIRALKLLGAKVYGYSLEVPKDTNSAYWSLGVSGLLENPDSQIGDVRNLPLLRKTIQEVQPDYLFHLAAQAFVNTSYEDPHATFTTNVIGTLNVLEASRDGQSHPTLVMVTSDKSYFPLSPPKVHVEGDILWGNDPYSASKAAAEQVIDCYVKNFSDSLSGGVSVVRAGNVFGGGDWSPNRLVPDFFRAFQSNSKLHVRMPHAVRPWTLVLDVLRGYLMVGAATRDRSIDSGQAWNFASGETLAVHEVLTSLCKRVEIEVPDFGSASNSINEVVDLQISATKALEQLGWTPKMSVRESLDATADWYRAQLSGSPMGPASDGLIEFVLDGNSK